jgi:hypothetical protein
MRAFLPGCRIMVWPNRLSLPRATVLKQPLFLIQESLPRRRGVDIGLGPTRAPVTRSIKTSGLMLHEFLTFSA